jgi:hypothetical protein
MKALGDLFPLPASDLLFCDREEVEGKLRTTPAVGAVRIISLTDQGDRVSAELSVRVNAANNFIDPLYW